MGQFRQAFSQQQGIRFCPDFRLQVLTGLQSCRSHGVFFLLACLKKIFTLAKCQPCSFVCQLNLFLIAETGALIQLVNLFVTNIRLDHYAADFGLAEQVFHHGREHLPAEA
ncbi:hypothetical protein SRABI106_03982 [Rahnella aquatilis]|nr:hypothetical protein SRABI106_03982 [Rahnella aquatilis]